MKIIIYRSKTTNQISHFHDVNKYCTDENIQAYNADEKHADFVEIVELEEDSLAYYFYNLKTKQIQDEADDLRDLMNDLEDIAERINIRLNKFDRWFESERGGQGMKQASSFNENADRFYKVEYNEKNHHLMRQTYASDVCPNICPLWWRNLNNVDDGFGGRRREAVAL